VKTTDRQLDFTLTDCRRSGSPSIQLVNWTWSLLDHQKWLFQNRSLRPIQMFSFRMYSWLEMKATTQQQYM